jgi:regulatory protein
MEEATAREKAGEVSEHRAPDHDPYRVAMARAGRLLTTRPRTEQELSQRLGSAGFEPQVIEQVTHRLRELRLVNDADFARQFVAERGDRKGRLALMAELEAKGVAREIAEEVLGETYEDEAGAATALAERRLRGLLDLPLETQAARLYRFLAGRGFSEEAAEQAVSAVLPPAGWD